MADDIRILTEGDLGDAMENTQLPFEDWTVNIPPTLTTAIANIVSGSVLGVLCENVKASLLGLKTLADTKLNADKVVEDLNTTTVGYAMGAKTGGEAINAINTNLTKSTITLSTPYDCAIIMNSFMFNLRLTRAPINVVALTKTALFTGLNLPITGEMVKDTTVRGERVILYVSATTISVYSYVALTQNNYFYLNETFMFY